MSLFNYYWHHYQLLDWIVLICISVATLLISTFSKPHCRPFEWHDPSINYPESPDTFPDYTLVLFILVNLAFYVLFVKFCTKPLHAHLEEPLTCCEDTSLLRDDEEAGTTGSNDVNNVRYGYSNRTLNCHRGPIYPWIKTLLWANTFQWVVVEVGKLYAGRLRPDYLSRLETAGKTAATKGIPSPRDNPQYFCDLMDTHPSLKEGRLSFPSGHSSTSFAVFTVTTFFFFAHLRPFARQGSFTRLCIALTPLIVPFFCAISRTRDHKHNFSDILAGSVIGVAAAMIAFAGTFREVGGAATIFLARSENDVEYIRQYAGRRRSPVSGAPAYNSTPQEMCAVSVPIGSGQQRNVTEVQCLCVPERDLNEDKNAVMWI